LTTFTAKTKLLLSEQPHHQGEFSTTDAGIAGKFNGGPNALNMDGDGKTCAQHAAGGIVLQKVRTITVVQTV